MNYLSNIYPVVSPVFSIYLRCNLIVSEFNQIGNLFSQFPISASYGNLIKIESTIDSQISIKEGIYSRGPLYAPISGEGIVLCMTSEWSTRP